MGLFTPQNPSPLLHHHPQARQVGQRAGGLGVVAVEDDAVQQGHHVAFQGAAAPVADRFGRVSHLGDDQVLGRVPNLGVAYVRTAKVNYLCSFSAANGLRLDAVLTAGGSCP